MGFSLILAGLFFLIIPTVNIVDIFPDFIGYLLIFAGLAKLKRIDGYMEKCAHYSLVMAIVNLSKPLALAFSLTDYSDAQSSNITTATLIFLVIELIFGLLLFKNLFSGLANLGYQYEDSKKHTHIKLLGRFLPARRRLSYEYSVKNKQSAEYKRLMRSAPLHAVKYVSLPRRKAIFKGLDTLSVFTYIFFAVHCVLTLIPELTTLAYTVNLDGSYKQVDNGGLRLMLIALCLFLGTILGVSWFCLASKYFKGVNKDSFFTKRLQEAYSSKFLDNPDVIKSVRYNGFYKLMLAALIFGGDLFLDATDFFPDIITALLLIIAFVYFRRSLPLARTAVALGTVYAVLSAFALGIQVYSYGDFYAATGLDDPLGVKIFSYLFPVIKGVFIALVLIISASQIKYMKHNFTRRPLYAKGHFIWGAAIIAISQIGSAVGYHTDIISDQLLQFFITVRGAAFPVNIYISITSFVVYIFGIIIFLGGFDVISRKLAGKE